MVRQAKYLLVLMMALFVAGNMAIPAAATLVGADLVGGIGASRTPKAGKLLPLDGHVKFPNSVLRTGHRGGIDSDKLDGLHSTSYARRDHRHDSDYVNADGDTMTGTLSAPDFTYSAPKTGRLRVPAAAFVGEGASSPADRKQLGEFVTNDTTVTALVAQVNLPDDAVINTVTAHIADNSVLGNGQVELLRSGGTVIASVESAGLATLAPYSVTNLTNSLVDNGNFYYWARATVRPGVEIQGLEILYTYTAPGR